MCFVYFWKFNIFFFILVSCTWSLWPRKKSVAWYTLAWVMQWNVYTHTYCFTTLDWLPQRTMHAWPVSIVKQPLTPFFELTVTAVKLPIVNVWPTWLVWNVRKTRLLCHCQSVIGQLDTEFWLGGPIWWLRVMDVPTELAICFHNK